MSRSRRRCARRPGEGRTASTITSARRGAPAADLGDGLSVPRSRSGRPRRARSRVSASVRSTSAGSIASFPPDLDLDHRDIERASESPTTFRRCPDEIQGGHAGRQHRARGLEREHGLALHEHHVLLGLITSATWRSTDSKRSRYAGRTRRDGRPSPARVRGEAERADRVGEGRGRSVMSPPIPRACRTPGDDRLIADC